MGTAVGNGIGRLVGEALGVQSVLEWAPVGNGIGRLVGGVGNGVGFDVGDVS